MPSGITCAAALNQCFNVNGVDLLIETVNFEDEILDAEIQENEATPLSDEEIALDADSQGTMASGSGGEKQDSDYDLTNYGIAD
uniref:Uncharacterized protein n=1 Tax=Tanacetum cinerariifolium TaxID=118510 RepID=A0A6L2NQI5_TANCI|nr:hypothetical protein [Tanacetum cinerariifolium]